MFFRVRNLANSFWRSVQEPKNITLLQFLIYASALAGGVLTLVFPPITVASIMGEYMSIWWGISLSVGGLFGVLSCPFGIWWGEKVALLLTGTGYLMYLVSIVERQIVSDSGSWFTQLAAITMLLLYLATRFAAIRFYAYDPDGPVVQRGSALRYMRG